MEGFITEYPDLEKYPKVATSFNSMSLCGYVQRTTFWDDFTSADKKGVGGIEDIFRQAFESRGNDVVFLTELTLVTNWKRLQMERNRRSLESSTYCRCWERVFDYCEEHFKNGALLYFIETLREDCMGRRRVEE